MKKRAFIGFGGHVTARSIAAKAVMLSANMTALLCTFSAPRCALAQPLTCALSGTVMQLPRSPSFEAAKLPFRLPDLPIRDFAIDMGPDRGPQLAALIARDDEEEIIVASAGVAVVTTVHDSRFPAGTVRDIAAGDFDGDGRTDVAALLPAERSVRLWAQRNAGRFERAEVVPLKVKMLPSSLGSVQRDAADTLHVIGDSDTSYRASIAATLIVGAGAPHFDRPHALHLYADPVAIGEWIKPGRISLLVRAHGMPLFQVDTDRGRRTFGELPLLPNTHLYVAGDFNGDRRYDLIVLGSEHYGGWFIAARGAVGIERPLERAPVVSGRTARVRAGDLDRDGLDDLLVLEGGTITLYRNTPLPPPERLRVVASAEEKTLRQSGRVRSSGEFEMRAPCGALDVSVHSQQGEHVMSKSIDCQCGRAATVRFLLTGPRSPGDGSNVLLAGDRPGPFICHGYNAVTGYRKWGRQRQSCPPHHAVFELDNSDVEHDLTCCPLPAHDVLDAERDWSQSSWHEASECPAGTILTGSRTIGGGTTKRRQIGCTKLNERKYLLRDRAPGTEWGTGRPAKGFGVVRTELPPAIQSGVGRIGYNSWDVDGCIGAPPGAVAVSAPSADCSQTYFSVLYVRRPDGGAEALPMYPQCAELGSVFEPDTGCTPGLQSSSAETP